MHLVLDHVAELEHVDHSHGGRLVETLAGAAVIEIGLSVAGHSGLVGPLVEILEGSTVEDRGGKLLAKLAAGPAKHGLEDLAEVHSRRHTQRVQNDIHRRTVSEERHILLAHDARHDTLVAVTAGHLVTHGDLTLLGYIYLGKLHDARGELVAYGDVELLAAQLGIDLLALAQIVHDSGTHQIVGMGVGGPLRQVDGVIVDLAEHSGREVGTLRYDVRAEEVLDSGRGLARGQRHELGHEQILQRAQTLLILLVEFGQQRALALLCFLLLCLLEEVCADDNTLERRRGLQRGILDITGLVAEDGTQELLLRGGIALTLGGDLTDHDVAGHDVGTNAHYAALVEILGGILAHVGDIGCELLHAALGLAHLEGILVHMHRCEDILTHHTLIEHDGVLIVVTLPGHERNLEVTAEGELTLLGGVTLGEDVTLHHTLTLVADRAKVYGSALVGLAELGQMILLHAVLERGELLLLGAVITDAYHGGVDKLDHTGTLGHYLGAGVADQLTLDACTDDRALAAQQRHSLAHHVRSHECAVGVIMLQERDERCCDRSDLSGRYIHKLHLGGGNDREVGVQTGLHAVIDELAVILHRSITLGYHLALLDLGSQVDNLVVVEIHHAILHLAVRCLDKAQIIDLGIDTERRDKTDVRALRGLDRTQTAVVCIVNVTHLEARTLSRQTAGAKGRHTALVGDLGQRIRLVHELRQGVGAEERVDDTRYGLGIDEIDGSEHLVVTHIHALADGARHTGQTHTELIVELLAYSAHAAVAQVVDIVHIGLRVDQLDQILDDSDDILLREHLHLHRGGQAELLVDTVAAHLAEVIALLGEEQIGDHLACRGVVRRLRVAKLPVYVLDSLLL